MTAPHRPSERSAVAPTLLALIIAVVWAAVLWNALLPHL